ncbi:MAG: salicylaldehyde dehydrogenase [Alphaproteobacteria bacterium]|nr:MAG: salicylaldehyde dehydrogenase [Alphaproteobacteria bacterium]
MAKVMEGMYIAGGWSPAARTFPDLNPSDGSVWANIADAGAEDARRAIEAAHAAFPEWSAMPFNRRSHVLIKAGEIFERRRQEIVEAVVAEGGGWFGKAMFETGYTAEIFPAAAAANYAAVGEVLPSEYGKLSMAIRRPMGVVSVISPWNFPLILSARGFLFPLVAGNTIVLKPSEDTPYIGGLLFAEIFEEAGLPKGALNVVTCSRERVEEVGNELIENPLVKGVSFTGSTAVGRVVAAKAGAHLKRCCVELGGKNALIVLDDADLDRAAQAANFGAFMHQGQICMSIERVIVHEKVHDAFMEKFLPRVARLKVGSTKDKDNVLGPVINDRAAQRIARQFADAREKGATILAGGQIDGRFVQPTVFANVTPDMLLYQEETFGPVCSIFRVRNDEEAIRIANDSEYGLTAGVMTEDEERGLAIVERLDTGNCHVNCSPVNDEPHVPFGGFKASGSGKHGGRWSMETFTETRWVTLERGGRQFPPVF